MQVCSWRHSTWSALRCCKMSRNDSCFVLTSTYDKRYSTITRPAATWLTPASWRWWKYVLYTYTDLLHCCCCCCWYWVIIVEAHMPVKLKESFCDRQCWYMTCWFAIPVTQPMMSAHCMQLEALATTMKRVPSRSPSWLPQEGISHSLYASFRCLYGLGLTLIHIYWITHKLSDMHFRVKFICIFAKLLNGICLISFYNFSSTSCMHLKSFFHSFFLYECHNLCAFADKRVCLMFRVCKLSAVIIPLWVKSFHQT